MDDRVQLSDDAQRLLAVLRLHAPARDRALTDRQLALRAQLAERDVIDLANELLAAGHLVLASSGDPPGRWLSRDTAEARKYANDLGRRAVRIWRRRKVVRTAIELHSLSAPRGADGQLNLFSQ